VEAYLWPAWRSTRQHECSNVHQKNLREVCVHSVVLGPPIYVCVGFSRRKILCISSYTVSEKAIWFQNPDYNLDRAQKLISSSMSRHLSTRNISSKSMHAFWVILLTDRQTDKHVQKHLPPPLSEIKIDNVILHCTKYLCVFNDSNVSWENHINCAFVHSHLIFGIEVYGNTYVKYLK